MVRIVLSSDHAHIYGATHLRTFCFHGTTGGSYHRLVVLVNLKIEAPVLELICSVLLRRPPWVGLPLICKRCHKVHFSFPGPLLAVKLMFGSVFMELVDFFDTFQEYFSRYLCNDRRYGDVLLRILTSPDDGFPCNIVDFTNWIPVTKTISFSFYVK